MIKLYIQEDFGGLNIYITDESEYSRSIAAPVSLLFNAMTDDITMIPDPTFRFSRTKGYEFLKGLAEALSSHGYRDKTSDQYGEIKRIENHLQDMRNIVFNSIIAPTGVEK